MRRSLIAVMAALAVAVAFAAPVGAREFGHIYAGGDTYRTFVVPQPVAPGTGIDPLFAFINSSAKDQYSVAQFEPGRGSHGGFWQVWTATWVDEADSGTLVTSYAQLHALALGGKISIARNPDGDVRCPLLPN
jgi:hypothetical protein